MKPKLDYLVVDIDNTFIYHRTVASANKLFVGFIYDLFDKELEDKMFTVKESLISLIKLIIIFYKFNPSFEKIKGIIYLKLIGFYLYVWNFFRFFFNRFFYMSSEKMIKVWSDAVIRLNVKEKEYKLSEEVVKKNINEKVLKVYNKLRRENPKMKVIAITQSFMIKDDPIKKILKLDYLESNKFLVRNKVIKKAVFNVLDKDDKLKLAEKYIKKGNVGIFIEDYDDISLLKLKNLKFVFYNKRLRKFVPKELK